MKLKKRINYTLDPSGKIGDLSSALMGAAFFLRALYYLVVHSFTECSSGEILLCMILPLVGAAAWLVLLRLVRLDLPRVVGVCAAVICVLLAIQGFFSGSFLRALIGCIWYLLAAVAFIAISFGYLPYRTLITVFMLPAAALRAVILYASYIRLGQYTAGLGELAGLCTVISVCCLSTMLKPVKRV